MSFNISLVRLFISDNRKKSKDQKKNISMCSTKWILWQNWKCSRKMWRPASANVTCDLIKVVLDHRRIIAECFDFFFRECYFTKYLWLLVRGVYLSSQQNQILAVLIGLRKANPQNIRRKLLWKEAALKNFKNCHRK